MSELKTINMKCAVSHSFARLLTLVPPWSWGRLWLPLPTFVVLGACGLAQFRRATAVSF